MTHPRAQIVAAALTLVTASMAPCARAQSFWQADLPPRADTGPNKDAGKAASAALSPNRIVGRVIWADAAKKRCVVRLDIEPEPKSITLIARTAYCAPRAILTPVLTPGRGGATAGYRVAHGEVAAGMEVVAPGDALMKAANARLAAKGETAPQPDPKTPADNTAPRKPQPAATGVKAPL